MPSPKERLRQIPILGALSVQVAHRAANLRFPGTTEYWERRYASGGTSGPGSYGQLAAFKAETLNRLIEQYAVESVVEFGCGDGHQLGLARYPNYIGLDVSKTAILRCKEAFASDTSKSFFLYDPEAFVDRGSLFTSDAALSIDVIFHLTVDESFETHMHHLFRAARQLVVIYASDEERETSSRHERHRRFTTWVEGNAPGWELAQRIPNAYPSWNDSVGSASDFFVYVPVRS